METGPLAGVDKVHPAAGWTVNGGEDWGFHKIEAMRIAEADAAKWYIEPLAQASQDFHDGAAQQETAHGPEPETVEISDSFLEGVADWSAQHDVQAERGPDMDTGLDR